MNSKVIGIILITVGIALAGWGYNVYDAVGSQIGRAISGDTPLEAWAGMVGGAICIIFGIMRVK